MKNFKNSFKKSVLYGILILFANIVKAQDFYYAGSKKVILVRSSEKIVVLNNNGITVQNALSLSGIGVLDAKVLSSNKYSSIIQIIAGNTTTFKEKLTSSQTVKAVFPVVKTHLGVELGLTDRVVLKFKGSVNSSEQNSLIAQQLLTLVSSSSFGNVYTVGYSKDALKVANAIFESGLVEYAHPDFLIEMKQNAFIPNDPYFTNQYNLHNIGQVFNDGHSGTPDADVDAPEAWDITKGNATITIAVIDEGVTSNHPDLPNTRQLRLNGSNFAGPYDGTSVNDPSPVGNGNHGNACAGIIAATQDNSEGVTGIAPNCKIMPIRIPFGFIPSSVYANAITFAVTNGAKILSNSWGYASYDPNLLPDIVSSIQGAVNNGNVVVFAAGNEADVVNGYQGYVTFPGNANVNTLITVGASDRYDKRANYSPLSNPSSPKNQIVDLVAPSQRAAPWQISTEAGEIWSIDIPGSAGYNPNNDNSWPFPVFGENLPSSGTNYQSYTGRMGGTSAATPLTAGIAGLLLSVNPSLTNQQVFDILTCSADDVGGYTYTSGYSNEMGHGRANAFNALMSLCISTINITWPINSSNGIKYQAGQYVTQTSAVTSTSKVSLKAGKSITFNAGTNLNYGSIVNTNIAACSSCVQGSALRQEQSSEIVEQFFKDNSSNENEELKVYPNPTTSGFLNFSKQIESFRLVNVSGIEVLQGSNALQVDVSNLTKGLYILHADGKAIKVIIE